MPQVRTALTMILLCLCVTALFIAGCGESTKQSTLASDSGTHPSGWLPGGHKVAAKVNIVNCTECHGADYSGGVAKVACSKCHMGDERTIHPVAWGSYVYSEHGAYVKSNGTISCSTSVCHGGSLNGAAGPSCTKCHLGGPLAFHPASWTAPNSHGLYVQANGPASCTNIVCHGPQGQGVERSGPACTLCHK